MYKPGYPGTRLSRGAGCPGSGSPPLSRVRYPGPNFEAGVQLYYRARIKKKILRFARRFLPWGMGS